jgi:hypothetical protein
MNKLKEKQKRIHHLRRRFLETANRLIEVNEAKMHSRSALLLGTIRRGRSEVTSLIFQTIAPK